MQTDSSVPSQITDRWNYESIVAWFEANGWTEWEVSRLDRHDRHWCKKFPGEPKCRSNQPKDLQLRAMLWDFRKYQENHIGLELELHARPADDEGWICIKSHGMQSIDEVPMHCDRMLKAWRAACAAS